jgi:outer membrane lipopolysaccharide assembly protein LptE/RlpB
MKDFVNCLNLTQKDRNCWTATLQRMKQENEYMTYTKKQKGMVKEYSLNLEFRFVLHAHESWLYTEPCFYNRLGSRPPS